MYYSIDGNTPNGYVRKLPMTLYQQLPINRWQNFHNYIILPSLWKQYKNVPSDLGSDGGELSNF